MFVKERQKMEDKCLGCGRRITPHQHRVYFMGRAFHDSVCAFEWFVRNKMGKMLTVEARQGEYINLMIDFLNEHGLAYEWFEYYKKFWR